MKRKNALISFLFIGAGAMLLMSLHYFGPSNSGILKNKVLQDTGWYRLAFFTHISGGLLAILSGPFQFMNRWIQQRPGVHKKMGYGYGLAVASSSLAGLVIAPFAMGGRITQVGFATLATLWFGSLVMAMLKIRAGAVDAHRSWMTINYALTFSAITQRSILLLAFLPSISFMPVYQLSSWLSWLFNLLVVLFFVERRRSYRMG
ncbi:MAG: DUF2306 domain-containing protein [Bacteroidota bacterium]